MSLVKYNSISQIETCLWCALRQIFNIFSIFGVIRKVGFTIAKGDVVGVSVFGVFVGMVVTIGGVLYLDEVP